MHPSNCRISCSMPISVKVAWIRVLKSDFNTRLLTFSRKSSASRAKFRILTRWCRPRPVVPTYLHMSYIRHKLLTATTLNCFNLKKIGTQLLHYAANKVCESQGKRIIWRHFKLFFVQFHRHPVIWRVCMQMTLFLVHSL